MGHRSWLLVVPYRETRRHWSAFLIAQICKNSLDLQGRVRYIVSQFPGGVTVAQEFLVLLVQVRILAGD